MSDTHAVRPLPPNPNLEFERKEAKKLLRRLQPTSVVGGSRSSAACQRTSMAT